MDGPERLVIRHAACMHRPLWLSDDSCAIWESQLAYSLTLGPYGIPFGDEVFHAAFRPPASSRVGPAVRSLTPPMEALCVSGELQRVCLKGFCAFGLAFFGSS